MKIQIFEIMKMAPRTQVFLPVCPVFSDFSKSMLSHWLCNEIEWNKLQTCSIFTHEHDHGV